MNTSSGNGKNLISRSFDLTTLAGLRDAIRATKDSDLLLLVGGPIPYLTKKLFEKKSGPIREIADSTDSVIQEQKKMAIDIIKAGKDNNASSIEITLDQKAGIDLGGEVEGIPLNFSFGNSGKMTIRVEYK